MGCGAILWAFVLCAPIRFKFWCHFAINCNWMSWIFISQPTILHNVTYLYQSALWELPCEYYWLTFTFIPTFTLIFMCWRLRLFWRICATETDVFTLGSWLRQKVCPYILRFNLLMVFCFQTDHHPHHCHCHRQVDKQINWIEEKNMQIHFAKLYWAIHTRGCKKKTEHCQLCTLWSPPKISFLAAYSKYLLDTVALALQDCRTRCIL